jgi:DUF971 family protein
VPLDLPDADPPTEVELDREHGLTLVWPDRTVTRFALEDLRRNCPCAECRERREHGEVPGPPAGSRIRAIGAELVGAWGLSIRWDDGHETGIYAWSILKAWAGDDEV